MAHVPGGLSGLPSFGCISGVGRLPPTSFSSGLRKQARPFSLPPFALPLLDFRVSLIRIGRFPDSTSGHLGPCGRVFYPIGATFLPLLSFSSRTLLFSSNALLPGFPCRTCHTRPCLPRTVSLIQRVCCGLTRVTIRTPMNIRTVMHVPTLPKMTCFFHALLWISTSSL